MGHQKQASGSPVRARRLEFGLPMVPIPQSAAAHQGAEPSHETPPQPSGLRGAWLWLLILGTLSLQGISWHILEGYQTADSIEYAENAQALVRGHDVIDSIAIRSAFFPLILTPPLWLADRFEVDDQRPLFLILRLFQMGIGLWVVLAAASLGARLGGRRSGLLAGWMMALNPVFLQYTVSPLTDLGAALCISMGLIQLARVRDTRSGWRAGIWMGLGVIVSYKAIATVAPMFLVLVLAERWQGRAHWIAFLRGMACCFVFQVLLDWATYGSPGHSLFLYMGANFGPLAGKLFWVPGGWLTEVVPPVGRFLQEIGAFLYSFSSQLGEDSQAVIGEQIRGRYPWHWYATSVQAWFVAPFAVCALAGSWTAFRHRKKISLLPLAAALFYIVLISTKGWKDQRLLLVVLPVLAAYGGWGLDWLVRWRSKAIGTTRQKDNLGPLRWLLMVVCIVLGASLGLDQLLARNTRKFSGYWEAMAWIQREADARQADDSQAPALRVASAYHWACFLRDGPGLVLEKLPHQIDGWSHLSDVQRRDNLGALLRQDYVIVHMPVLTNPGHMDLLHTINRQFAVHAMFWNQTDFEDIGPVFLMKRRTGGSDERTLYAREENVDPRAYRQEHFLPRPRVFVRPDLNEEVWFLGFQYEVLPGDDHGWITLHHWCASERIQADYAVVQRVTTVDESNSYQANFHPAWGAAPTNSWTRGTLLRESYPVLAAAEPFAWQEPYRPMGGEYRRGDLMPAWLWLDYVTFDVNPDDGSAFINARLELAKPGTREPLRGPGNQDQRSMPGGFAWSLEGHVQVGSFLLAVPPDARVTLDEALDKGEGQSAQ